MTRIPDSATPDPRKSAFQTLCTNFPIFAKHCLKIRTKDGKMVPFQLNRAQLYVHQRLEEQKATLGFVRAIIVKARQLGSSTLVAGRYFQSTLLTPGTSTFIVAHQSKSTAALFDMVRRFLVNLPQALLPGLDTSNKNQIKFSQTASEYSIGTAGSEDVGRGMTIKNLHLSEAGYYPNAEELVMGLLQAVADLPGTEVIIESTACGVSNFFYRATMAALAKKGHYQVIFLPWFMDDGYRLPVPEGFMLTDKEQELKTLHKLDDDQIFWRRKKIEDLGDEFRFFQEFPSDVREAFLVSGESFFPKDQVTRARANKVRSPEAPVIMGVDCARSNDRSVFVLRQGRAVIHYEGHKDLKADGQAPTQQLIAIAVRLIEKYNVAKVFIDAGYGYGVVDGLHTLGYKKEVMAVNFAQQPLDTVRFLNKRAEMYGLARDWFADGNVSIPDTDEFAFDLLLTPKEKQTPTNRMYLVAKNEIREKHGVSPDVTDAFILTFAFPVAATNTKASQRVRNVIPKNHRSSLTTLNRLANKAPQSMTAYSDF